MTHHFDEFGRCDREGNRETGAEGDQPSEQGCCEAMYQGIEPNPDCCSGIQRDRFELLSAYLDGEVTAAERRQVEGWLATDSKTQRLYSRLLTLRQGLQTLPVIQSNQSIDQLVNQVTARVDRQPVRLAWGGLVAAGLLIGALFNALPPDRYMPSVAQRSSSQEVPSDGLMIALNHPPIAIPKATIQPMAPSSLQKTQTIR
jgi:hypothetical protein